MVVVSTLHTRVLARWLRFVPDAGVSGKFPTRQADRMHGIADYDPLMSGLGMHRGSVLHLELAISAPRNEKSFKSASFSRVLLLSLRRGTA